MRMFIRFLRPIFLLIEVFCYNPPRTIRHNQSWDDPIDCDRDSDTDEPLFL